MFLILKHGEMQPYHNSHFSLSYTQISYLQLYQKGLEFSFRICLDVYDFSKVCTPVGFLNNCLPVNYT